MIVTIRESRNPKIAVITPLYEGHDISLDTQKTIGLNDISFIWVSAKSKNNIPTNLKAGLEYLQEEGKLPEYYFMLDRDIMLGEHIFDKLYETLSAQPLMCAYAYASFEFRGYINMAFPADEWDISRLKKSNYISSNSLFRSDVVAKVELVTDDKYKRLLDWAFLLKLAKNGYYGTPCPEASFIAKSTAGDISAGSKDDYVRKHIAVVKDFAN